MPQRPNTAGGGGFLAVEVRVLADAASATTPSDAAAADASSVAALEFGPPFNRDSEACMRVTNTHPADHIAFKVKTTAPDRYRVSPNTGTLSPGGGAAIVHVLLTPLLPPDGGNDDGDEDARPPPAAVAAVAADKFLVQAVRLPHDLDASAPSGAEALAALWARSRLPAAADLAPLLAEKKVPCRLLLPPPPPPSSPPPPPQASSAFVSASHAASASPPIPHRPLSQPPLHAPPDHPPPAVHAGSRASFGGWSSAAEVAADMDELDGLRSRRGRRALADEDGEEDSGPKGFRVTPLSDASLVTPGEASLPTTSAKGIVRDKGIWMLLVLILWLLSAYLYLG
ncbi:hypothetical protein HK405_001807 [Cladochytrium tenue]|nr:hypothetical protein HK405_001807 [Cladochytrium tenue]